MVNTWGQWFEEEDYSVYPKEKWCLMDYMAAWIREENYQIKTDMEFLIEVIINQYQNYISWLEHSYMDENISEDDIYFDIEIMAEDMQCFVKENGGLKEYDELFIELYLRK